MRSDDEDENNGNFSSTDGEDENYHLTCGDFEENRFGTPLVGHRYRRLEVIGAGSFGTVYKAIDLFRARIVACKRFRIPALDDQGLPQNVIREIGLLRHLCGQPGSEDYLVRLLDVVIGESTDVYDQLNLILDYYPTDLYNLIYQRESRLRDNVISKLKVCIDIASAVRYLHRKKVAHLDIKPHNILVDSDCRSVRLADFGMSRLLCDTIPCNPMVVTSQYRPPELILPECSPNKRVNCSHIVLDETKIDSWSLIVTIYELFAVRPLFGCSAMDSCEPVIQMTSNEHLNQILDMTGIPEATCSLPFNITTVISAYIQRGRNLQFWPERKQLLPLSSSVHSSLLFETGLAFDPALRWPVVKILDLLNTWLSSCRGV